MMISSIYPSINNIFSNPINTVFLMLEIVSLLYICIFDIKKKIILDRFLVILLVIGVVKSIYYGKIESYYIGICIYNMPLLFLYSIEDYFRKELVGFGDIKLVSILGGLLQINKNIYENNYLLNIINFYRDLYIISGIFCIIVIIFKIIKRSNKDIKYIPFAPFIIMTYIIHIHNMRIFNW